jgi:hypothetical protein
MSIDPNERKLAELILYISQKYANDPYFGAVKLNKAIFFPDFTAYASWGETITNAEYQHQPEGPTVYRMLPILDALQAEGALVIQHVDFYGLKQKRTVNLRPPDLSYFDGREIAVVDGWLETLRPMTGTQVSRISHETAGWKLTSNCEKIDPKSVFIGWREPNAAEIRRGQELALRFGLLA